MTESKTLLTEEATHMNKTQKVAEALAQFLGPHTYDQTPKDKAGLFKQNRGRALSQEFKHSQEDLVEMAKAAIDAIVPEGSVVVPREVSEEAVFNAFILYDGGNYTDQKRDAMKIAIDTAIRTESAMIKASEDQTHE